MGQALLKPSLLFMVKITQKRDVENVSWCQSALNQQNHKNQGNLISKLEQCGHVKSVINQQNKDLATLL
jgi:hypothetical protein